MKRYCLIIAALLLTVFAMAQDFNQTDSKGRRQGQWRDFYPNGQLRYEGEFKNNKCKGTFRYYDEQGNLIPDDDGTLLVIYTTFMNEDDMSDEQLTGIEEEQQILFESIREQNLKKMMEKFRGV